ncbi:MAG: hypothetical protein ATN33_02110 [Epulopiscium sp. Nele67-Bin001]|nr:MAG: hypothetical protein BEN18_01870 [Epulopiscium sp. Nuni2H_MBin001]OON90847.1 MAG: hypothetical protein ATN33_02110 [Epulopiscium sp. Nele67-Bin001]
MQKFLEVSFLYDFYQTLLTQKQRDLVAGYYFEDLSLSELASTYNISRQSVFDTIKKAELKLVDYESKLQLWDKFKKQDSILAQLQAATANSSNEEVVAIRDLIIKLRSEV